MNKISIFIKKEFIILSILFLTFTNPFFYGNRIDLLFFGVMFFNVKYFIPLIDKNIIYVFLFTITYEIISSLKIENIDKSFITIIPNLFGPPLLYLIGKYISINYRNIDVGIFFLFFISLSFSLFPIFSILLQIEDNGFLQGSRSMYLIWDKNYEISATVLGGYLTLNMGAIGLLDKNNTKIERTISIGIIISFILSLICALRLGSRTQLVLAIISIVGSFFFNVRKNSFIKNLLTISSFSIITFYIINNLNQNVDIVNFYSDRLNNDEVGIGTAGGRTEKWSGGLKSIITDPFGWELSRFGYAHNLWLDVARVAGVVPLIILIFFQFRPLKLGSKV